MKMRNVGTVTLLFLAEKDNRSKPTFSFNTTCFLPLTNSSREINYRLYNGFRMALYGSLWLSMAIYGETSQRIKTKKIFRANMHTNAKSNQHLRRNVPLSFLCTLWICKVCIHSSFSDSLVSSNAIELRSPTWKLSTNPWWHHKYH